MYDILIKSFGFKYGSPKANNFIDVSFIKNPARLQGNSLDTEVSNEMKTFVLSQYLVPELLDMLFQLCKLLIKSKDKPVVAFGCSAGRHRSWIIAEEISERLTREGFKVKLIHEKPED